MASDSIVTLEDEIFELYRKLLSGLPQGILILTRQKSKDPAAGEDIVIAQRTQTARESLIILSST
jgi:hypothetical protein